MIEILCPICKDPLIKNEGAMKCENGHSYDISRKGYVNLLPSSGTGHHGDDRLMVKARTHFLDGGYYDRLSAEICGMVLRFLPRGGSLIDAGCGEGKYTGDIFNTLAENNLGADLVGLDISKEAINALVARNREIRAFVVSTSSIPVDENSVDVLLNVFSPFFPEEFSRVLKPDGVLIRVVPDVNHLWELKKLVYDTPYKNPTAEAQLEGFTLIECRELKYKINITDNEIINDLFLMTPYFYKTGKMDQEKLKNVDNLSVSLEFVLCVYLPGADRGDI